MNKNYPLYNDHPCYRSFEQFLDGVAERFATSPAFTYRDNPHGEETTVVSYRQFARDVRALASEAMRLGMSGKHCALIGGLSYEWICAYAAIQMIGAVIVPLDREWTAEDLADTVNVAECDFLFYDHDLADKAALIGERRPLVAFPIKHPEGEGVLALIRAGDPFWRYPGNLDTRAMSSLVFTSGTTGKGKGVMLCQDGIFSDLYNGFKILRAGERTIVTLPPHHTYGSNIGVFALLYAGTSLYLSNGLKYIVKEMKEFKPDFMVLVPLYLETFYRRIMKTLQDGKKDKLIEGLRKISNGLRHMRLDLRRQFFKPVLSAFGGELRFIISGGAPLRPELIKAFDDFGILIINGYGITECSPLIGANRNEFTRLGSVGVPLPSMDVKIEEPNENGEGEICVRGENVMLGYYKAPEETARVIDADRYFHTGDIGRFDEDGVLYITGRLKNLIILSNGKNVYPEEIETDLSAFPGVADVVVYEGVSRRGAGYNQVVAEIYPDPDFLEKNGIEDPKEHFAAAVNDYNKTAVPYKRIGCIKIRREEFPKNTLRKITRFKLDMSID